MPTRGYGAVDFSFSIAYSLDLRLHEKGGKCHEVDFSFSFAYSLDLR